MMDKARIIELKTDSDVFQAVKAGKKTFEIRKNDRDFQVGDTLVLRETVHTGEEMRSGAELKYTGEQVIKHVSHVLRGPIYGLSEGWAILSLEQQGEAAEPVAYAVFSGENIRIWSASMKKHLLAEFGDSLVPLYRSPTVKDSLTTESIEPVAWANPIGIKNFVDGNSNRCVVSCERFDSQGYSMPLYERSPSKAERPAPTIADAQRIVDIIDHDHAHSNDSAIWLLKALQVYAAESAQAARVPECVHELIKHCRKIGFPMVSKESMADVEAMQDALHEVKQWIAAPASAEKAEIPMVGITPDMPPAVWNGAKTLISNFGESDTFGVTKALFSWDDEDNEDFPELAAYLRDTHNIFKCYLTPAAPQSEQEPDKCLGCCRPLMLEGCANPDCEFWSESGGYTAPQPEHQSQLATEERICPKCSFVTLVAVSDDIAGACRSCGHDFGSGDGDDSTSEETAQPTHYAVLSSEGEIKFSMRTDGMVTPECTYDFIQSANELAALIQRQEQLSPTDFQIKLIRYSIQLQDLNKKAEIEENRLQMKGQVYGW